MDYAALAREIPADELLNPPDFPLGEVLKPATGGQVTSNPASSGEQKPANDKRGSVGKTKSGRKGF
jgi:hypothetical protein